MKKNILYLAVAALVSVFSITGLSAQKNYKGGISFSDPVFTRTSGGMLDVNVVVDLSRLDLHRQQAVVITPVLVSGNQANPYFHDFDPIVVAGKARYKAMRREVKMGNLVFDRDPAALILHEKGKKQTYTFKLAAPFEPWMEEAVLVMSEDANGCASCEIETNEYALGPVVPTVIPPYITAEPEKEIVTVYVDDCYPDFRLSLVMPPHEMHKQRNDTYSAWIHFEHDKSVIRRNVGRNAQTLWEVDQTINKLRNDKNVNSITIFVKGYASPEGDPPHNVNLSRDRAYAFVDYLSAQHGFTEEMINFYWAGEDWYGLRRMVEVSDIKDRMAVINIVDFVTDNRERERRLKSLSGGETYNFLLHNYYPTLRRVEYTISYTLRPFNLYEAKALLRNDPAQLSLYEMYKVASTYKMDSYEFREVFDIAARVYPTDPVACINASALDIAIEADDVAISRIYTLNNPEAWNNLAIAYFKKGFYELAEEYFRKAAAAGEDNAVYNLKQFNRWKDGNRVRNMEITPGAPSVSSR